MAQDLRLVLKITGDASGLKAEIVGAKQQIDTLGQGGQGAGSQAAQGLNRAGRAAGEVKVEAGSAAAEMRALGAAGRTAGAEAARGIDGATDSLGSMAATAGRAIGVLAGFAGTAAIIWQVAQAGDAVNAALGRLSVATGSAEAAADVYQDLYELSLRTGVATNDAAGSFLRFAIAAREAGASRAQILSIVQVMQQAGALAGATGQEIQNATVQLGQGLASGRMQMEELNSVVDAMPNLVEALARQLGVGVGEMRKLAEEGKLTSDVIIPGLVRAAEDMNRQFESLPPSLSRSMGILATASGRFIADLDTALRLSRTLANIFQGIAGSINTFRVSVGLGNAEENATREVADARSALIQARRAGGGTDGFGLGEGQVERAEAALKAAEDRLEAIRAAARDRTATGDAANAARGAENRQRSAEVEIQTLRETLNRRIRIRREAAEREELIEKGLRENAITPAQAADLRAQNARRLAEELDEGGRGGARAPAGPTTTRAAEGLARVAQENERARESFDRLRASLDPAEAAYQQHAQALDTITAAMARGVITEEEFRAAVDRSRDALGQRLQRAQDEADGTAEAQRRVADGARSLGLSFTSAFENSIIEGRKLGDVLKSLEQDLARIALRKAVTEPLAGAATSGLNSLFRSLTGGGTAAAASAAPAIDASAGGFLFHTGGVAGHDATPARRVSANLFATAPRYHAGGMIGPDEVPAILQRGEGVFTAEQMARMGPAGGSYTFAPTIHFQGDAGRAEDREALIAGLRSLWARDIQAAAPGIVQASKASLRADVQRMGSARALGAA